MKRNNNGVRRRQFGGVLITALIFATIISLFALGVAMVATSHMSRNSAEADYATAIQLADAGINHELRWLGDNPPQAGTRAHQLYPSTGQPGPQTVNLPDGGSYTVAVMNEDGSGPLGPAQLFAHPIDGHHQRDFANRGNHWSEARALR